MFLVDLPARQLQQEDESQGFSSSPRVASSPKIIGASKLSSQISLLICVKKKKK